MKPHVTLLMLSSLDGRLHPSRWTRSPDGDRNQWSALYEKIHGEMQAKAWMVGRVTMAEMAKGQPHPPSQAGTVERPVHIAERDAPHFAIALDPSAKLHFAGSTINGDHVIVVLGQDVPDSHLAELAGDGISYIVSECGKIDLGAILETLSRDFGIQRLLLEGGGIINGEFLGAGLVDEVNVLVGPAFDGDEDVQGIVVRPGGLAGTCELSFAEATALDHGIVRLRYKVRNPSRG